MHMPVSESVAAAIAAKAAQEARERDKLKRLILQVGNQFNAALSSTDLCWAHMHCSLHAPRYVPDRSCSFAVCLVDEEVQKALQLLGGVDAYWSVRWHGTEAQHGWPQADQAQQQELDTAPAVPRIRQSPVVLQTAPPASALDAQIEQLGYGTSSSIGSGRRGHGRAHGRRGGGGRGRGRGA